MKDKRNTKVEFNIEISRTTLPPKSKYIFLEEANLLENILIIGSQAPSFFGFAPTESPKYLKGSEFTL